MAKSFIDVVQDFPTTGLLGIPVQTRNPFCQIILPLVELPPGITGYTSRAASSGFKS